MINLRDKSTFSFTAAGGTGLHLTQLQMMSIYDDRREISAVIEVTTGSTAPGSTKNLTFKFASVNRPNNGVAYTAAELATAAEIYTMALPNATNTRAVYVVPNFKSVAQFLNYWFDCDALTAGATLSVVVSINSNPQP